VVLNLYIPVIAGFIASFLITYLSIPSILRVVELKHLFVEPGERHVHSQKVPTLGGMAIFAGFTIAVLLFGDATAYKPLTIIIAAIIVMFFIGIKDDILIIAPLTKFGGQVIAALIVILAADLRISSLHGFFNIHEIPYWISIILTLFTVIVVINAVNFIDGIDGLAATISSIIALTFGIWFWLTEQYQPALIAFSLIGALLAFLRFNFSKTQKIFMGDTGSLIIGLLIAFLAVQFNESNLVLKHSRYYILPAPTVSFAILIVPLFDMIRIVFIRFFSGNKVFLPDKQHIHHKLLDLGLSHGKAVLIIAVFNILFIALVIYLSQFVSIRRLLLIVLLISVIVFYIPSLLIKKRKNEKQTK